MDRATFYDRTARVSSVVGTETPEQYLRRPINNYHAGTGSGGSGGAIVNNGGSSSLSGAVAAGVVVVTGSAVGGGGGGATGATGNCSSNLATTPESRGRTRDRLYRNGLYSSLDR